MLLQLEDAAIVEPQPFPNGIAPLDHRIEWADAGLVAVNKPAVDVD